ncbi:decapping and exoribonuclease protein-like [Stegodyphus dumicola]|uniref:decapping and exoribonuclease protein-like n=1 Tax=Stegodyphus dumicola TaxID=202533 RepID=UPI0015B0EF28|nr:decapping and exoribonuclease protein-like [Stegodyphus dumicola]
MTLQVTKNSHCTQLQLFQSPLEIGFFSVDSYRRLHFDRSQMKYYVRKPSDKLYLDLNAGYGQAITSQYDTAERMDQILQWIQRQRPCFNVDFITLRGTLTHILCTPYMGINGDWSICATKFKGIIYFREVDTESKIIRDLYLTEREKQMSAWGYKFEQYMVSAIPNGVPNVSSTTHQVEEFSVVVNNRIGRHSLLFTAEIDCVDSNFSTYGDTTKKYIELKTSKIMTLPYHYTTFQRFKSLQWWAQSHVAGVEKIVCGMRDDNGIVHSIAEYETSKLPLIGQGFWDPNVCHNFCNDFLEFLKETVTEDNPRVVYKLDYRGGDFVTCAKLMNPELRFRIIPEWFM